MRKVVLTVLTALLLALPPLAITARAQPDTAAAPVAAHANGPLYSLVVGLGAVAGVAVYNMASYGVSGVPGLAPAVRTGAMVTASAIAQNRLYTVVSAAVGGIVANWLYGN